uniref:Uncharacterized protein n=1 Tax=Sphaerodactylus townsendi TaxID=933632 RepID=A0ACB8EPD8_9SAUR
MVPDLCSQEQGVEMQPQARGAAEASEEKKDQLHEPPPEEAMGSGTVEVQTATTTEEASLLACGRLNQVLMLGQEAKFLHD